MFKLATVLALVTGVVLGVCLTVVLQDRWNAQSAVVLRFNDASAAVSESRAAAVSESGAAAVSESRVGSVRVRTLQRRPWLPTSVDDFDYQTTFPRRIKVAVIPIGLRTNKTAAHYQQRVAYALPLVHAAGAAGCDLVVLPEEFTGQWPQVVSDGPMFKSLNPLATKYKMIIFAGLRELDAATGRQYNTIMIIGRQGELVGSYRKQFPCCPPQDSEKPVDSMNEGVYPGNRGVHSFDFDFGRVALLTCFDAQFPEIWQQAWSLKADILVWPSAYRGGDTTRSYTMLYHWYLIPCGSGDVLDIDGTTIRSLTNLTANEPINVKTAILDLDRVFVHRDYNRPKVGKLLRDFRGSIASEGDHVASNWFLLSRTDAGFARNISVRQLLPKYDIETLRSYQFRTRAVIDSAVLRGTAIS
eukprot:TRINITY_DN852_c0_g1_i2.p1 TRINITY_DN852_c0_g1~~TRINITY_DN852_c0_g1_i2.p1  ORF type:complete len:450 (-),score=81.67 TRINITY_DN852_c0_g1_i2:339-1580(-)